VIKKVLKIIIGYSNVCWYNWS